MYARGRRFADHLDEAIFAVATRAVGHQAEDWPHYSFGNSCEGLKDDDVCERWRAVTVEISSERPT